MFSLNKCVFSAALISALATVPVYAEDASDETSNVEEKTCDAGKTCVSGKVSIGQDNGVTGGVSNVIAKDGSFIFDNYHFLGVESSQGALYIDKQEGKYDSAKDKIVISNSKFEDNTSDNNNGGAIWVRSDGDTRRVISIYTSDFIGNRATGGSGGAVDGGYYIDRIVDSVFENNSATGVGGAIFVGVSDYQSPSVLIDKSTFKNNTASTGGALSWGFKGKTNEEYENFREEETDPTFTIRNSTFEDNKASAGVGGAINLHVRDASANLMNNTFIGNEAKSGGALILRGQGETSIQISDEFRGNKATGGSGGAIYVVGGYEFYKDTTNIALSISDALFAENEARQGGALYISPREEYDPEYDEDGNVIPRDEPIAITTTITNAFFTGNKANVGGAVVTDGDNLQQSVSILDTSFTKNEATIVGGAVYTWNTDLLIAAVNRDVEFSENVAAAGEDVFFEQDDGSTFSLRAAEGKTLTFYDSIATYYEGTQSQMLINYTDEGESTKWTGTVAFNDRVGDKDYNFDIWLYSGTLKLGALNGASVLDHNSLTIDGASALDTQNGAIDKISLSNFTLNNSLSWALDVDLTNATMDSLLADAVEVGEKRSIKVSSINILNDSEDTTSVTTSVLDALRQYVSLDEALSTVKSENYAYKVSYNNDDGTFKFERTTIEEEIQPVQVDDDDEQQPEDNGGSKPITGDGTLETADPIVAEKASSMHFANELQNTINTFFFNDYMTFKHTAALSSRGLSSGEDPLVHNMWVRAFGYDDTYHYKNFQNVEVKTGMLTFGVSSDVKELSASTDMVYSLYAGTFDGKSRLADRSVKVNENGGYVGAVATFMRNDWTFGGNLTLAYDRSETKDAYGSEKYDNYWGGMTLNVTHRYMLAKTYSLDGGVLGGATVVKGSSGHTTTGDRIKTDDMTVLSFTPTLKFNKHLDEKNILFVEGRYMMIDSDAGQVLVNDVSMDTLSSGNYAEYGVGYQRFDDPVSVDIAVYRRTGDRDGYSVDAGLKWSF